MILRIVDLKVYGPHELDLTFNNGVRKRVDVAPLLDGPVFRSLRSCEYFAKAKLDAECGTLFWPNGADIAPESLLNLPEQTSRSAGRRLRAPAKAGK